MTLLVLALAKPALSQRAADLNSTSAELAIDWFYLAAYPLIYSWSLVKLWFLVGGATALLLLTPWLPPRRRSREAALQVTLHPGNRTVSAREDNFRFIPVLSDPAPEDGWQGRTHLVHAAILADFPTSPAMRFTPAVR